MANKKISKFEDTLLRCYNSEWSFRRKLFDDIDSGSRLRGLRAISRTFRHLLDTYYAETMFRQLFIDATYLSSTDKKALKVLAPACRYFTIKVGYTPSPPLSSQTTALTPVDATSKWVDAMIQNYDGSASPPLSSDESATSSSSSMAIVPRPTDGPKASTPQSRLYPADRYKRVLLERRWINLLSRFAGCDSLTLRINGDPGWPGRTEVEDTLLVLKTAIENANLENLRTFILAPVHAMGIIHLRWFGLGSFGNASPEGAKLWQNIETLDIRIHNPLPVFVRENREARKRMFTGILYDYLRSFAPTLRCLRFVWLGEDGPSPLTLHLSPDSVRPQEIHWPRLEELWFGNILQPHRTFRLVPSLAPRVTRLKTLHTTRRETSMDVNDSSRWIQLNLPDDLDDENDAEDRSSVYSRTPSGISNTSRELDIYLDV